MTQLRFPILCIMLLGAVALGGCNSTPAPVTNALVLYDSGNYTAAAAELKPLASQKTENFVLNSCRYGSCALAAGELSDAEQAFMQAYEVINGVNTNDGGRTLGATLVFEGVKVWKGEPFERAMAHYYLGLINLIKTPPDYENARAAFRNSLFKLRAYAVDKKGEPEADQYQAFESNFALGFFGLGYAYLRDVTVPDHLAQAKANFDMAVKLQPTLADVVDQVMNPDTNTLLFVDYGSGPKRSPKGWYNEESAFGPTPAEAGPIPPAALFVDGQQRPIPSRTSMVDTLAMAQDQKWQDIDTIRKTKAVIGTGAMAAGAGVTAYGADRGDAGTALAGVGIMALGAALAASSQADLRYWEFLPRTVYVIPAHIDPGTHNVQVNVNGHVSPPFNATIRPKVPNGPDTVLYLRIQ